VKEYFLIEKSVSRDDQPEDSKDIKSQFSMWRKARGASRRSSTPDDHPDKKSLSQEAEGLKFIN
jgi:hypothetical protein